MFSPLVPPHEGIDANFLDIEELSPTESILSHKGSRPRRHVLQSPLAPDGHPLVESPRSTEGLAVAIEQVITIPPAPSGDKSLPNTPRTPRRRSMSLPNVDALPSDHQRSHSESAKPSSNRHLRRRPLLIDDQSSLHRLTTLFESHNLEELDHLIASPVVAESFDAFTRPNKIAGNRSDKVRQITGEDEAQAFHEAQLSQGIWYLRPTYNAEHEIQISQDGTVSAGTLRALVERLTVDFSSKQFYLITVCSAMLNYSVRTDAGDQVSSGVFDDVQVLCERRGDLRSSCCAIQPQSPHRPRLERARALEGEKVDAQPSARSDRPPSMERPVRFASGRPLPRPPRGRLRFLCHVSAPTCGRRPRRSQVARALRTYRYVSHICTVPNVRVRSPESLPRLSRPSPNGPRRARTGKAIFRAWTRSSSRSTCACTSNGSTRRSGRRSA